jgi:competence protein ComEA
MSWLQKNLTSLLLGGAGLLLAIGLIAFLGAARDPAPIAINPPRPTATSGPVQVYVSGAVAHPEIYILPAGSIVRDALESAGGPIESADLSRVNLAAPLSEGQQVHVPALGESPPPSTNNTTEDGLAILGPVNINTASQPELETLPGIGPAIAERIITYRETNGPFALIEDIQNVSGIGPATFEEIKDLITVGP